MSDNCILCLEHIDISEKPLICGHKFHIECLKKHFKPECPLCRRTIEIDVTGTKPELYLPFNPETIPDNHVNQIIYIGSQNILDIVIQYENELQDENEDEDEENRMGDIWDYEDV